MYKKILFLSGYILCIFAQSDDEITPHKFASYDEAVASAYIIPESSRYTLSRQQNNAPDIIYYMSKPKTGTLLPIAILCEGSTPSNEIASIIYFHRYFLEEFLTLPAAVITLEQWGIDGNSIDKNVFMKHYTRSQRLKDHQTAIEYFISNPPHWWNGKFILFGVSEGGPLVTKLTENYNNHITATINWCGAGCHNWCKELWGFICELRKNKNVPWWIKLWDVVPSWLPFSLDIPKTYTEHCKRMKAIQANPTTEKLFMDMTYLYHADALAWPEHDYRALKNPFLIVVGTADSIIHSADAFAENAKIAGANITYFRVEGMDHYIRLRPDIIAQSFEWLKKQI